MNASSYPFSSMRSVRRMRWGSRPPWRFQAAMERQAVRLLGRVLGRHHGDLHHLFLEQRDTEGALEHRLQLLGGIVLVFLLVPPPQVGMDHVPWIGPGRTMATWITRS